ncbi:MAG: dihydropteroate synthase [Planctomycetia bacterium]
MQAGPPAARPAQAQPPQAARRPALWGILNVTPDSFSDGGLWLDPARAVEQALRLVQEGADVLDVGGESTRPGAQEVPVEEEVRRTAPVIAALRAARVSVPISIDTRKAAVARAALEAGATIVNDVSAGLHDPAMLATAATAGAGLVLMHMQGQPATMQRAPEYGDVLAEVAAFLSARRAAALAAGVSRERLWVDPGIGFGKTLEHNLALLQGLERLEAVGPVLLGASRKSFLGALTGRPAPERLLGSLACAARAAAAGVAAVRVHDVAATRELLDVLCRISPAR